MLCVRFLSVFALSAGAALASSTDTVADLSAARQALQAAIAAEARATAEFHSLLQKGSLSPTQTEDYRTFLSRLSRMVKAQCDAVSALKARIGDTSTEPDCGDSADTQDLRFSFPDEQTEGERVLVLERRLGESLSEFDDMLLREMEQLARTQSGSPDAANASGSGSGEELGEVDASGEQTARSGRPGDKTDTASDSKSEPTADRPTEKRTTGGIREADRTAKVDPEGTETKAKQSGAVDRDDVPDAGDDDVVARQLREAAENETDPELREKLWQEYKRYKSDKAQTQ